MAGVNERLRVQESGAIALPSVPSAAAQSIGLCMDAAGLLGSCSGGSGGNPAYSAATGLSPAGTAFSVAPTYQLPQSCVANQIAQWNGTTWACANTSTGGATLPAGVYDQTLRYDSSNALVANNLLRAFADGGLLAGGADINGTIPQTGTGTRMMRYPGKQAFRAGHVGGGRWDDANVGSGSVAMGIDTQASGVSSTAMGSFTTASGIASTALGAATTASDTDSTAMGFTTQASGNFSTARGFQTVAGGTQSIAICNNSNATGDDSIALGDHVNANRVGRRSTFLFTVKKSTICVRSTTGDSPRSTSRQRRS